jgi:hypothetical protein
MGLNLKHTKIQREKKTVIEYNYIQIVHIKLDCHRRKFPVIIKSRKINNSLVGDTAESSHL